MDRVNKDIRTRIMRSNKSKNTGPEIEVRRSLVAIGIRYRINYKMLPGKPDIVITKYRIAIFIHGCFWHGHKCKREPYSKSNRKFWKDKIENNMKRDLRIRNELLQNNWRLIVIWECALRRKSIPFEQSEPFKDLVKWINRDGKLAIITESGFEACL